jgi:hypothetical protein
MQKIGHRAVILRGFLEHNHLVFGQFLDWLVSIRFVTPVVVEAAYGPIRQIAMKNATRRPTKIEMATLREETFVDYTKLASGVHFLFVNGQATIKDSKITGCLGGRALRRTSGKS